MALTKIDSTGIASGAIKADNIDSTASPTFQDLTVTGNLTVSGTTTTINTETIALADSIIVLNSNYTGSSPSENGGVEVERGTQSNVSIRWNETTDKWEFTNDGTNFTNINEVSALTGNSTVSGHLLPTVDVTYDLGSASYRFRDLYLSGATINLGGAKFSVDPTSGTVAITSPPTQANPNPTSLVVTPQGKTVSVPTTGGVVDFSNVATVVASNPGFSGSFADLTNKPSPVITLGGDLTGSVTLTDLASGTLTATLATQANVTAGVYTNATVTVDAKGRVTEIASGAATSTVEAIEDLSDVLITSPTNGQVLKYNGSQWVNGTDAGGADLSTSSIDDLQDVVITSPSNGQVLKFNGTNWVNGTDSTGAGGGGGDLTAVASNITPDTTDTYDIGSSTFKFYRAYFSDSIKIGTASLGVSAGALYTQSSMLIDDILITEDMIVPSSSTVVDYYGDAGIVQIDGSINCTGNWIRIPAGTEAERPITGITGMIRFNETSGRFEGYGADEWAGLGGLEQDSSGNNVVTGNLVVTGDVISLSDMALKENITPIDSALEIVDQLKGYFYNLKGQETRRVGLIAQNVEQALPEAVIDSDGSKAVAYGNIVGVLIESIKELKAEIAELRSRIS